MDLPLNDKEVDLLFRFNGLLQRVKEGNLHTMAELASTPWEPTNGEWTPGELEQARKWRWDSACLLIGNIDKQASIQALLLNLCSFSINFLPESEQEETYHKHTEVMKKWVEHYRALGDDDIQPAYEVILQESTLYVENAPRFSAEFTQAVKEVVDSIKEIKNETDAFLLIYDKEPE